MEKYLYLLQCADGSFYSEVTEDFEKSISEHIEGINPESYTFSRRPVRLVFFEKINNPGNELEMERLMAITRKRKLELLGAQRKQDKIPNG